VHAPRSQTPANDWTTNQPLPLDSPVAHTHPLGATPAHLEGRGFERATPVSCASSLCHLLDEPPHSRAAQECAPQPPSVQLQHTRACSARRNHPVTALARTHGKLHSGQSARRKGRTKESAARKRFHRLTEGCSIQDSSQVPLQLKKNSKGQHLSHFAPFLQSPGAIGRAACDRLSQAVTGDSALYGYKTT
jgi:hypothetical protein